MTDPDEVGAPLRARVRALAAIGATPEDIRQLCGVRPDGRLMSAAEFAALFVRELALGAAEANVEVSKALFEQATTSKSATVMLAWAKYRLGWSGEGEGRQHESASDDDSQHALAALSQLLDQLAARKAGSYPGAAELADGGPSKPTAASH